MTISELATAVKERNLGKDALERYRDELTQLIYLMREEKASLEKREAIFLDEPSEDSNPTRKRKWKATKEGQRDIELKHHILSANKLYDSIKSRLYSLY